MYREKLDIGVGGKEVEIGTTEHLTNPREYPWKKRPLGRENLVRMTELVHQNILPLQNIPGCQGDQMTPGPEHYFGGHSTKDTRHCTTLMLEVSDNSGVHSSGRHSNPKLGQKSS